MLQQRVVFERVARGLVLQHVLDDAHEHRELFKVDVRRVGHEIGVVLLHGEYVLGVDAEERHDGWLDDPQCFTVVLVASTKVEQLLELLELGTSTDRESLRIATIIDDDEE